MFQEYEILGRTIKTAEEQAWILRDPVLESDVEAVNLPEDTRIPCPICFRENPEDARFCNGCGAPMSIEQLVELK